MTDYDSRADALATYTEACRLAADGHEGLRRWFMGDAPKAPIDIGGGDAFRAGFGEEDCPYRDDYDGGDYWASPAGLRHRWLSEWRYAWRANMAFRPRP